MQNTLFYGDNLEVLQKHVADASVDLVYLDPPFNSNRDYNVLFKEQSGDYSPAQIKAFGDTWKWANAALDWENFAEICPVPRVIELMTGFVNTLGKNDVTAYLVMMAPRLYHLHRVLKPTGSLYLHCDPTASHYLKLLLDATFGPQNFRNEIIWKRTNAHGGSKRWGPVHDVILFYSRSNAYTWHKTFEDYSGTYVEDFYRFSDDNGQYRLVTLTGAGTRTGDSGKPWRGVDPTNVGRHWAVPLKPLYNILEEVAASKLTTQEKLDLLDDNGLIYWPPKGTTPQYKRYLDENPGVPIQDTINDIQPISAHAAERLGYPTQKPLALLERIIHASSNPGDVVLDPFCGCGTAIVAAQALDRHWIGIDVTPIATSLIIARLDDRFRIKNQNTIKAGDPDYARAFAVEGLPTDVGGAREMFRADHKKFEMWAVGLVPATPQEKKGADQGIDGLKYFHDGGKSASKAIVQVKGGGTGARDVRDLVGTMAREKAALGLFICLETPTQPMRDEAVNAGFYQPPIGGRKVARVQIRTVAELLNGQGFDLPFTSQTFMPTARDVAAAAGQGGLEMDV